MKPLSTVLVLLALLGCERPGLKPVAGELVVTPETLAFEPTFIGYPRELEVSIGNRSRASRTLVVRTTGPFDSVAEVIAAGGSETPLSVRFAPGTRGDFTGTLTLSDEAETVVVQLTGSGVAPTVCTSTACETNTFDPALGRCVATRAIDGSSCTNACLTGGKCEDGRCVGTAVDCSDTNPCTLDACDPVNGCQHPPVECAASTNPCKVSRCDPNFGCAESDVRDGIACGASDCVTAQVCIGGMCKSVAAPDGSSCGMASPCQGTGTCQRQVCVMPPGGQLTDEWSYDFPGPTMSFAGVHDPAQNLYWLECAFGGLGDTLCDACTLCAATSVTSAGVLRFRKVIPAIDAQAELQHLLAGDVLIYASKNTVGGISSADGAPLWSMELPLNLAGVSDVADAQEIKAMASTSTGLTLVLARRQGSELRQGVLLQLNPVTGATLFAKIYDGLLDPAVIDESGAIALKVTPWYAPNPPQAPSFLVSLSANGLERWRVFAPASAPWDLRRPVAAFGGELLLDDGELRSMTNGARLATAPEGALSSFSSIGLTGHPLMTPTARLLLRLDQPAENRVNAISLRPGMDMPTWEVPVHDLHGSAAVSQTVATASGGFIVAAGDSRHPTLVKGYSQTGAERFSCGLPWNAGNKTPATLLDRRWVAVEAPYFGTPTLHVYDVGDEFPAQHGWSGARGSPSGANRPLP